jgi:hypothetical protein
LFTQKTEVVALLPEKSASPAEMMSLVDKALSSSKDSSMAEPLAFKLFVSSKLYVGIKLFFGLLDLEIFILLSNWPSLLSTRIHHRLLWHWGPKELDN